MVSDISGKKKAYLRTKIEEHETNSNKKISGKFIGASMPSKELAA
jgi:hypothetical protein